MFQSKQIARSSILLLMMIFMPLIVSAGMFDGLKEMVNSVNPINKIGQIQETFGKNGLFAGQNSRMQQAAKQQEIIFLEKEARLYLQDKRFDLAVIKAEEALALAEGVVVPDGPHFMRLRELAAEANYADGLEERAILLYRLNVSKTKVLSRYIRPGGSSNLEDMESQLSRIQGTSYLPINSFIGLAKIYEDTGNNDDALQMYLDGLALAEKHNVSASDPNAMIIYNSLGMFYFRQGDFTEAKKALTNTIKGWQVMREDKEGMKSLSALSQAFNVASRGRLSINNVPGIEAYENLGSTYLKLGEHENLKNFYYEDVKSICEDMTTSDGGRTQPEVGGVKINEMLSSPCLAIDQHFALLLSEAGYRKEALDLILKVAKTQGSNSEKYFSILYGEYFGRQYLDNSSKYLSSVVTITHGIESSTATERGFEALLNNKGRFFDYRTRLIRAATETGDRKIKKDYQKLKVLNAKLTELSLAKDSVDSDDYSDAFGEKLSLEIKVKRALHEEIKADFQEFSAKDVYAKIPQKTAYVDIVKTDRFDNNSLSFDGYEYYAFVVTAPSHVEIIKLGTAEKIDKLVKRFHSVINEAVTVGHVPDEAQMSKVLTLLQAEILAPVLAKLSSFDHLIISPDGSLNLLPFEILPMADGRYLIEDFTITYVTSGRDLVKPVVKVAENDRAVVFADPLYSLGSQERSKALKSLGVKEGSLRSSAPWSFRGAGFSPLPDTQLEALQVGEALKRMGHITLEVYQQDQALEEVLLEEKSPRFLHIATHGYFIGKDDIEGPAQNDSNMNAMHVLRENPMLRSGIALAGANTSLESGIDYGVVSAEKICQIDLSATEMVVLSACNTGSGDVQSGEGVFGLQRSILTAGAQSLVMSSWSVPSKETTELMSNFYSLMAQGLPKAEALRQAKLSVLKESPNPFYWGAFVYVGQPEA